MKIQIIQLEKHDDVISVRDKMAWCKAPRILLVWPRNGRLLTRQVDLVLLARFSVTLGAQLGLVTRDSEVVAIAAESGIPTFNSIVQAQRSYWLRSRTRLRLPEARRSSQELRQLLGKAKPQLSSWMGISHFRWVSFIGGVLAFAALLVAFVPGAVVKIRPESQVQQLSIPILASSKVKSVNLNGSIPLRQMVVDVEGKDTLAATGKAVIATQAASGEVQFTNLTDQPLDIPVGTVVLASKYADIRFATSQAGKVLAGPGTTVILPVQAMNSGENGNLPAMQIDAIDGMPGLSLSVTNLEPITGGASRSIVAVSSSDLAQLKTRLTQTLLQQAQLQLSSIAAPGDQWVAATLKAANILDEQHFPEVDQPGNELSLSLSLEVNEGYISGSDLQSLASMGLEANIPVGYRALDNKIDISTIKDAQIDQDGDVHWQIQARRNLQHMVNEDQVVSLIPGLKPGEASRQLVKNLHLQSTPEIALFPAWWPRLPLLSFRIALNVSGGN